MDGLQNRTLAATDPVAAAKELVEKTVQATEQMRTRVDAAGIIAQDNVQVITALEELKRVQDAATWGIRMLIELTGEVKKGDRHSRRWPSQRAMVEASGVSLASVHEWINHPAGPSHQGLTGPGTLAKPGQTSHRFSGGSDGNDENDDGYDE